MNEYQIGGGLRLLTAIEKSEAFAEFVKTRLVRASKQKTPRNALPARTIGRLPFIYVALL